MSLVEVLFCFFIRPHWSQFVIRLKKQMISYLLETDEEVPNKKAKQHLNFY